MKFKSKKTFAQGGIIKKHWFQWWKQPSPPRCHFVTQSRATPLSKEATACSSCCMTWGIFKDDHGVDNVILLDIRKNSDEY